MNSNDKVSLNKKIERAVTALEKIAAALERGLPQSADPNPGLTANQADCVHST